jgi:hypothetical protein
MAPKLQHFHGYRKGIRYSFAPLPMVLIYDEAYQSMSAKALILYSLILNRMYLSERNQWEDENGVYIYYSIANISADLNCSEKSARKYQKELVDFGLIELKISYQGKPTKIYPYDFAEPLPEQDEAVPEKEDEEPKISFADMDHVDEKAEESPNVSQNEDFDTFDKDLVDFGQITKYTENEDRTKMACLDWNFLPNADGKKFQSQMVKSTVKGSNREWKKLPTEKEYLEKDNNIYNPSIYQETKKGSSDEQKEKTIDRWMDKKQTFEQQIKENLSIDAIKQRTDWPDLDMYLELYQLMVDSCRTKSPTIRIGGEYYPAEKVRERFLELTSFHLEYVIDSMKRTKTKIRNIRSYLLTALYRSPDTITSYYQAEVNHDTYEPEKPRAKNEPGLRSPSYTDEALAELERSLLGN